MFQRARRTPDHILRLELLVCGAEKAAALGGVTGMAMPFAGASWLGAAALGAGANLNRPSPVTNWFIALSVRRRLPIDRRHWIVLAWNAFGKF